jgi:hypothetical protein
MFTNRSAKYCCGMLLALLPSLHGCGPTSPKCVPVTGTVTLDGEKVPGPGRIYFTVDPAGNAAVARPGTAEFDADGKYQAKSFVPGDGLMPGKYLLRVDCWQTPPNMDGKPVVSFIPQKYQSGKGSGLELTVEPESRGIVFDIKLISK